MESNDEPEISGSYSGLNNFVRFIHKFQQEDFDLLIGVSSFKGFGKTTFANQVGKRLVKKYMPGENWSFDRFNAWDNNDVRTKAHELPFYGPMLCDEAVRFAMAEDWMYWDSKDLKKLFTQIRTKHLATFFNVPDIWWLDRKYREGMMTVWVHIISKGYAIAFLPDLRPGLDDRFHRKELLKHIKPFNFFTPLDKILPSFRGHPCYYDEFAFPKLPEEEYQSYLKIRNAKVFQKEDDKFISNAGAIATFNIYNNPDIVRGLVQVPPGVKIRVKSPSYRWIADHLFKDPGSPRSLISPDTARIWNKKILDGKFSSRLTK